MSFHYHGHGEHKQKAGDCHIIARGLSHTVTGWSEDVELLEMTAPGHYKTTDTVNGVEVAPAPSDRNRPGAGNAGTECRRSRHRRHATVPTPVPHADHVTPAGAACEAYAQATCQVRVGLRRWPGTSSFWPWCSRATTPR